MQKMEDAITAFSKVQDKFIDENDDCIGTNLKICIGK